MRGKTAEQSSMLCLVSPESRVPHDHPLRGIKKLADAALRKLSPVFDIALHSIRSERQFCEQLEYNLLFRWFVDMDMLEAAFDASTFSKNRERLMEHEVAALFFATIRERASGLMSADHFSVDGTLLEAWASMKPSRRSCGERGERHL